MQDVLTALVLKALAQCLPLLPLQCEHQCRESRAHIIMAISYSCHQSEHQHCKIARKIQAKKKPIILSACKPFRSAQPGPPGVREPLPSSNSVRALWRCLPDVRHQAAVQPPGPVHAHRQRLAGERARHAGSEPALRWHAERRVSSNLQKYEICCRVGRLIWALVQSCTLSKGCWNWNWFKSISEGRESCWRLARVYLFRSICRTWRWMFFDLRL